MLAYIIGGGFPSFAVLACGAAVVIITMRYVRLRSAVESAQGADAVLFWACAALGIGVVGTLLGISSVGAAIAATAAPSTAVAWAGVRMALSTSVLGAATFLVGIGCWWVLRRRTASAR